MIKTLKSLSLLTCGLMASTLHAAAMEARDEAVTLWASSTLLIDVLSNDRQTADEILTIQSITASSLGTVTLQNGLVSYTSNGTLGTETLTYVIADSHGNTATANLHITVEVNNIPGDTGNP